ncbi:MAG: hypothetical protein GF418_12315 [Chitinivibrionales bacterium]|nr:hypothetical protein [Chitinivibrionales bacterium]MBD3396403.1 hypothetical protein [Chitinivibrionales bacterium]
MKPVWLFTIIVLCSVPLAAKQEVLIDREFTWTNNSGRIGHNYTGTLDWRNGEMFRKVVVTDKPTDFETALQVCVWSGGETCSPCICFQNTGLYYGRHTTDQWWKKGGQDLTGWTTHGTRAWPLKSSCCGAKWLSTCGGSWCMGSSAAQHLPITLHVIEIYVPDGETFDCPEDWVAAPWEECQDQVRTRRISDNKLTLRNLVAAPADNGHVRLSAPGATHISLYTTQGQLVVSADCNSEGTAVVETRLFPAAMLIVRAATGEGLKSARLVIQE